MAFFADISSFAKTSDYLPIFNGILISDLLVILILHMGLFQSKTLQLWYKKYSLSAVLADTLIILIVFIIARYLWTNVLKIKTFSILTFIGLLLLLQIAHDYLFYLGFSAVPRGSNEIIDFFKNYAAEMSYRAILGDSALMISSGLAASLLASQSYNFNLIVLVVSVYLVPYFVHK